MKTNIKEIRNGSLIEYDDRVTNILYLIIDCNKRNTVVVFDCNNPEDNGKLTSEISDTLVGKDWLLENLNNHKREWKVLSY